MSREPDERDHHEIVMVVVITAAAIVLALGITFLTG
jgi:hypothetical protein